jgi:AraC-like DNA-binding protein
MSSEYLPTVPEVLERDLAKVEAQIAPLEEERRRLKQAIRLFKGGAERQRRSDTGDRLRALVEAEPGLTTKQIAERLQISIPYVYDLVAKDVSISRDETGVHFIP